MKKIFGFMIAAVLGIMVTTSAFASGEKGTPDEAVKMVKKAENYMNKNEKDKAFADFSDPENKEFHDRDLYVFVFDVKGTYLAHGNNKRMIGKNLIELKDADGSPIIKNMIDIANKKGSGWIDYKWPNPVTKEIDLKSTYFEKLGDIIIACGIYKK